MNLLFLVEGKRTEPKIYKAWLSHLFPNLNFVLRPEDMTTNSCRIIGGNGYPNMISSSKINGGSPSRLKACLLDIKNFNNVDYFFICLDSEEYTYQARFDEILFKLDSEKVRIGLQNQATKFHIIIQHCCMETWALGNAELPTEYTPQNNSTNLSLFQAHYDVLVNDPELMIDCPLNYSYSTKAQFHESYLKAYLQEFGLFYSKKRPKIIGEKNYLDALIKRCMATNHLSSLKYLLDIWDQMKNP